MIVKNKLGDYHVSDKTVEHGFGWGGGIYFRTKTGKWKFNGIGQPVANAKEVDKNDINQETKLPWGLDPATYQKVES
ncbi:hypothetical protein [Enterobacter phage Phc]|nr:hypothetical protein [Enterobacter phage Phc]